MNQHRHHPEPNTITAAEAKAQCVQFLCAARSIEGVTVGMLRARFRVPERWAVEALRDEQHRRAGRG